MTEGVDVRGYFVWSFMDNFEWGEGNAARFGLVWVDYLTRARVPKGSCGFYARLVQSSSFSLKANECNASGTMLPQFQQEAAELQKFINASAVSPTAQLAQQLALRTARLAVIAEMQARYETEQGDFDLARYWGEKALKLKSGAQKQQMQLQALREAQLQAQAQQHREEQQQRDEQVEASMNDELLMSLPVDEAMPPMEAAEVDLVHDKGSTLDELLSREAETESTVSFVPASVADGIEDTLVDAVIDTVEAV